MRRWLLFPLYAVAAAVILFEDFLWEPLQQGAAWLGQKLRLRRLEGWIADLPPYPALGLFLGPTVLLFPLKLIAVSVISQGFALLGMGILAGAKVVGTAVVARLFTLCKPKLMSVTWFARAHRWVTGVREDTLNWLRKTPVWQIAGKLRARLRTRRGLRLPDRFRRFRRLRKRNPK